MSHLDLDTTGLRERLLTQKSHAHVDLPPTRLRRATTGLSGVTNAMQEEEDHPGLVHEYLTRIKPWKPDEVMRVMGSWRWLLIATLLDTRWLKHTPLGAHHGLLAAKVFSLMPYFSSQAFVFMSITRAFGWDWSMWYLVSSFCWVLLGDPLLMWGLNTVLQSKAMCLTMDCAFPRFRGMSSRQDSTPLAVYTGLHDAREEGKAELPATMELSETSLASREGVKPSNAKPESNGYGEREAGDGGHAGSSASGGRGGHGGHHGGSGSGSETEAAISASDLYKGMDPVHEAEEEAIVFFRWNLLWVPLAAMGPAWLWLVGYYETWPGAFIAPVQKLAVNHTDTAPLLSEVQFGMYTALQPVVWVMALWSCVTFALLFVLGLLLYRAGQRLSSMLAVDATTRADALIAAFDRHARAVNGIASGLQVAIGSISVGVLLNVSWVVGMVLRVVQIHKGSQGQHMADALMPTLAGEAVLLALKFVGPAIASASYARVQLGVLASASLRCSKGADRHRRALQQARARGESVVELSARGLGGERGRKDELAYISPVITYVQNATVVWRIYMVPVTFLNVYRYLAAIVSLCVLLLVRLKIAQGSL